jgi:hypothetical protein
MDTNDILDGDFGEGISLQTRDLNYLRTAGKWGQFISITGLILIALGAVVMVIGSSSALMMVSMMGSVGLLFIPYLLLFGVMVYLYILMYQFSTNAVSAAGGNNRAAITEALKALSRMFVIGGVLLIVYLGLIAFSMLFFFGVAAAY